MDATNASLSSPGNSVPSFMPSAKLARNSVPAITSFGRPLGPEVTLTAAEVVGPDVARATEQIRQDMGVRVERAFSALAYRAVAQGMKTLRVAELEHFTIGVHSELVHSLDLTEPASSAAVLDQLATELRGYLKADGRLGGDWGSLRLEADGGIVSDLAAPPQPETPTRKRAKVVDGLVK